MLLIDVYYVTIFLSWPAMSMYLYFYSMQHIYYKFDLRSYLTLSYIM
jgi:hypothetical protein